MVIVVSVWLSSNCFQITTPTVFLRFSHDLCANTQKTAKQILEILILKNFWSIFLNFKFGLWNSVNRIPALTFYLEFFTLGELMPLDGL